MKSVAKLYLFHILPALTTLAVITVLIYSYEFRSQRDLIKNDEANALALMEQAISNTFYSAVSDLMVLSDLHELKAFIENSDTVKKAAAKNFLIYSRNKKLYDQIRYLDEKGMEIMRVNFNELLVIRKHGNKVPYALLIHMICA